MCALCQTRVGHFHWCNGAAGGASLLTDTLQSLSQSAQFLYSDQATRYNFGQKHTDYGFGYKAVYFNDDKFSKPVQMYRGENAIYKFMEKILEEVVDCKKTVRM